MKKLFTTSLLLIVLAFMFAPSSQAAQGKVCTMSQCCGTKCLYYKKVWINPNEPGVTMNYYGSSRPSYVSGWNHPHEYYRGANFYHRCAGSWKPSPYTVFYRSERPHCPKCNRR